jgi:hypothetical protein
VPFRDDLDAAVGHLDGGLSVHGVSRTLYPGGPAFRLGQALVRTIREVEVREDAEMDDSQHAVTASGRLPVSELIPGPGVSTMLPALSPT